MLRKRAITPMLVALIFIIIVVTMFGLLVALIMSITNSSHSITFVLTHSSRYNGSYYNWRGVIQSSGDGVLIYSTWKTLEVSNLEIPIQKGQNLVELSFQNDTYVRGKDILVVEIVIEGRSFYGKTIVSFENYT